VAGFLSIRCGRKTNYTDENNITWVTDADYIDVGETADIGNVNALGSPLDSLRFFPKPLKKSCYTLPVPSNVLYLLRLWFLIGNYSGFQTLRSFNYSFKTVDMLAMDKITLPDNNRGYDERIIVTSGKAMNVCLIRTSKSDDPFISGIELRPLRHGMNIQAEPGTMLKLITRIDCGGKSSTLR
jgi:hypothetical protein